MTKMLQLQHVDKKAKNVDALSANKECTYDAINPNQLSKQNYKELYSSWTHLKTERSQLMEVFKLMGLDKEFEYCKYS